jgi:hypothetical protein
VIRRVSRNFVPVALNLYEIRKAKGTGGDFFRAVQKQRPAQYQGLYAIDPAGKVLSSQANQPKKGSWVNDTLRVLDDALDSYGEVTRRKVKASDPLPDRGKGVKEDGGIVLAVYTRPMVLGLDRRGLGAVAIDSVALTAGQRTTLGVPDAEAGITFEVPGRVVRLFHKVLSATSDASNLARPNEVTQSKLTGKVVRVRRGIAYLSFQGFLTGVHAWPFEPNKGKKIHAEVTLRGVGTADAKSGKLLSLTLVGDGRYRHFPPYDEVTKYGAVVQWRAER